MKLREERKKPSPWRQCEEMKTTNNKIKKLCRLFILINVCIFIAPNLLNAEEQGNSGQKSYDDFHELYTTEGRFSSIKDVVKYYESLDFSLKVDDLEDYERFMPYNSSWDGEERPIRLYTETFKCKSFNIVVSYFLDNERKIKNYIMGICSKEFYENGVHSSELLRDIIEIHGRDFTYMLRKNKQKDNDEDWYVPSLLWENEKRHVKLDFWNAKSNGNSKNQMFALYYSDMKNKDNWKIIELYKKNNLTKSNIRPDIFNELNPDLLEYLPKEINEKEGSSGQ